MRTTQKTVRGRARTTHKDVNTNGKVEARRRQQKATDQAGYWVRSRRQSAALGVCLGGTPSMQI